MKIIVTQIGARHHYAIPRMFENSGNLESLYTDFCAQRGAARALNILLTTLPTKIRPRSLARLIRRQVDCVPTSKIHTSDRLFFEHLRQQMLPRDLVEHYSRFDSIFAEQMIRAGTGKANTLYSMFGEGRAFLKYAKMKGLKIAVDVYINPLTHVIYKTEQERFPTWPNTQYYAHDADEERVNELLELADILLCPSTAVFEGLKHYSCFDEKRARIVPYGCSINYGRRINQPVTGRVLFSGNATLGKGIHYLAQVATLCAEQGKSVDFRVAGSVLESIRSRPECSHLNFLGHLSKSQLVEEYMTADVFVLPTLAEGSASVVVEALAAGIPVVTTHSAGSVITHGVEGLIVPERDPEALMDAVMSIVENRQRRDAMALAALRTAKEHTEENWSVRLLDALKT